MVVIIEFTFRCFTVNKMFSSVDDDDDMSNDVVVGVVDMIYLTSTVVLIAGVLDVVVSAI